MTPPADSSPTPHDTHAPVAWNRWLVPVFLVLAAIFLAGGLWIGARIVAFQVASRPVKLADDGAVRDATRRLRAENAALEQLVAQARSELAGDVCHADPAQMPSLGPDSNAPVSIAAMPAPPSGMPKFHGSLIEFLRQATVLVVVPQDNGTDDTGSGFFIAADLVVTNRHVVAHAGGGGIFIANSKLGRPLRVSIVAETPNSEIYAADFAVLKVSGETGIQPLALTEQVEELEPVVTAGFPGLLLKADNRTLPLLRGDSTTVPSIILTAGRINAVQVASSGLTILPHSALVLPGNSGGPLVDSCGRVVGVNTFTTSETDQAVHVNYAQKSDTLIGFLHAHQLPFTEIATLCAVGRPTASMLLP
jgi:S1-C subfamily serine protease